MKKLFGIITFTLVLFSFVAPSSIIAQTRPSATPTPLRVPDTVPTTGLNMTLSPTYISLITDPGKKVSSQFKIINNNTFTEYLEVTVAKMTVGADGKPVLADIVPSDVFATWLRLEDQQFIVGPNQSKIVKFEITPPQDAALGYYYTLLVSRMKAEGQGEGAQAVIAGAAAITVLLDVRSPDAKRELQVADFKTDKLFYEYLPTTFNVTVKNTGNVHVVPFGDIFIDSLFNKQIANIAANPGRGNALPGSERVYSVVWDDAFATLQGKVENGVPVKDAKGRQVMEAKYDFSKANKFRIGKYTARLIMVYDNGQRDIPIEATVSFWIIPWKIILGVAAVVIAPALVVFLLMRLMYKKRK